LKEDEERFVPSFDQILDRKVAEKSDYRFGFKPWMRPASITLLLILLCLPVIYYSQLETDNLDLDIDEGFVSWEAPTDFLLSFNDQPYTDQIPDLGTTFWELETEPETDN
jgi:hypothetical protein